MEELLAARVSQLKDIDERLERVAVEITRITRHHSVGSLTLDTLRFDLRTWIDRAEREYAEF
jgi:hypothetical protein